MNVHLFRAILLVALTVGFTSRAQNLPFPQHITYTAGTIKPAGPQAALDQATRNFYDAWKARYLVNGCRTNEYYVHYSADWTPSPSNAVAISEGHGYGMLIMAFMAGYEPQAQTYFDGMYRYFTNHFSARTPYLMSWQQVTDCVTGPNGGGSATDGDLDIAYALLLADRQWGSTGEVNYLGEARKVINALMAGSINKTIWSVRMGDWSSPSSSGTRPSDFMFGHFRAFAVLGGDTNWLRVVEKCYAIISQLQTNHSPVTGLLPDFAMNVNAVAMPARPHFLEGPHDGQYNYNACRTPWRLATDYLLSGDPRALTAVSKMNGWIRAQTGDNPANLRAGYSITNGTPIGNYTDLAFNAPFAVGAMVSATNQVWLDRLWTNVTTRPITGGNYYGNTLKMLNLIVLSGNWWAPQVKPVTMAPAR